MKKWIPSLFVVTLISGCSTIPSTPKPHTEKYAVQIIKTESSNRPDTGALKDSNAIEKYLTISNVKIDEYPTLYTELGAMVISDQTKPTSLADDFSIEGGKVTVIKKTHDLGSIIKVSLIRVENETVTFSIDFKNKELKGFDDVGVVSSKVKIPVFNETQINTEMSHVLNGWVCLGGLANAPSSSGDKTDLNTYFYIRIIPPQAVK